MDSLKIEKVCGKWFLVDGCKDLIAFAAKPENLSRPDDEILKVCKQNSYAGPFNTGTEACQEMLGMCLTERL